MNTTALFATDLHGNQYAYEALFSMAAKQRIETIILGGDLTPKWPLISWLNRALVPLDPDYFKPDKNGCTYDGFLASIEPLVKKRTAAEKHFIHRGGYLLHTGECYTWEQLRAEQRILRRLIEEYQPDAYQGMDRIGHFILTATEWQTVYDLFTRLPRSAFSHQISASDVLKALRLDTLSYADLQAVTRLDTTLQNLVAQTLPSLSIEARQYYQAMQAQNGIPQHTEFQGKHVHAPTICLTLAQEHPLFRWIKIGQASDRLVRPQTNFLNLILRRWIKAYRAQVPKGRVFLILGNDDVTECEAVVKRLHASGLITLIHQTVADMGYGLRIAGYPFVRSSQGALYNGWEKSEADISVDLARLEQQAGNPLKTIFVIHTPAHGTHLDQGNNGQHFGSSAVRHWLTQSAKYLVLSGHIHEAPFVNGGIWKENVNGTLCMQPGARHGEGLCAIRFNLIDPSQAEWISPTSSLEGA